MPLTRHPAPGVCALFVIAALSPSMKSAANIVIVISVDGLRPDAITTQSPQALPSFYRLRTEGAFTDNARTDFHFTTTLPNHVDMVTGRPIAGLSGHKWTENSTPPT